jgi:hypothetical protein
MLKREYFTNGSGRPIEWMPPHKLKIDISSVVQPLAGAVAQRMYVDRKTVSLDGFSRPHEAGPNIFACLGFRTHGLKNRCVGFHRNPLE